MLTDAQISIVGIDRSRTVNINKLINGKVKLSKGELIVNAAIKKEYLKLPNIHVKRTKNEKIDYPLITTVAHKYNGNLNIAFSSLCEYPVRFKGIENI